MQPFTYRNDRLFAEDVDLTALADLYGTPCYVYSRAAIEERWRAFDQAFAGCKHLVCYAVKANSNLAVLNLLARLGSGFDIVSGGELERVLAGGGRSRQGDFFRCRQDRGRDAACPGGRHYVFQRRVRGRTRLPQ